MEKVDSHGNQETKQLFGERNIKWRLKNLIENGEYEKKALIRLPDDMKNLFGDHETQNGSVSMDILKAKVCNDMKMTWQPSWKPELNIYADLLIVKEIDPSKSLLMQYEEAISVNKKGYSVHYKRVTDEIMVNTYNPEWIAAWNGNMDFQLCQDNFAVITYISDCYAKDDSGTIKVLQEAVKESHNEDL